MTESRYERYQRLRAERNKALGNAIRQAWLVSIYSHSPGEYDFIRTSLGMAPMTHVQRMKWELGRLAFKAGRLLGRHGL